MASPRQIHVEGNGNIVIQDVQGSTVEIIRPDDPALYDKLRVQEVQLGELLAQIQTNQSETQAIRALLQRLETLQEQERRQARRRMWMGGGILLVAIGFALVGVYQIAGVQTGPFDFTVQVLGDLEDPAIDAGNVVIAVGDQLFRQPLETDRRVRFQLDRHYLGQVAQLRFEHDQPYELAWDQTSIPLEEDAVLDMPVRLQGLAEIQGYLYDFATEQPLVEAVVRLQRHELQCLTDSNGRFRLTIPPDLQQKFQDLVFEKAGYRPASLIEFPVHTQQFIQLPLERP